MKGMQKNSNPSNCVAAEPGTMSKKRPKAQPIHNSNMIGSREVRKRGKSGGAGGAGGSHSGPRSGSTY